MRLKENIHVWKSFARNCEGGPDRARALILAACQILREHHALQERIQCYETDPRFDELKQELKRIGRKVDLDSNDSRACSIWILGACLCVIQTKNPQKNDSARH